jgi:transposase
VQTSRKVYIACGPTDLRKSIDGLAAKAAAEMGRSPVASEAMFAFCNRARDRLKVLEWEADGFWLHTKRLEAGRFPWPMQGDGFELAEGDFALLLESPRLAMRLARVSLDGLAV